MLDWNVVVTVHGDGYRRACALLERFGAIRRTDYYNVLVMKVGDRAAFLGELAALAEAVPEFLQIISRVMPASATFTFQSAEQFEAAAREIALAWTPELAGKSFHVRVHRRGFRSQMSSQQEERFLDDVLLAALERAKTPGRLSFDDPDVIIDVDTVGQRAGLSLWTREDLRRYPFLKLD